MAEVPSTSARFDLSGPRAAPNGWERELLQGFRDGERQALEAVYRRFAGEIAQVLRHGFAFESRGRRQHFVGYRSAHDLHDALHETFRRAFEDSARRAYDGIRPYGPYLRTIARNLVLGEFRRREKLFVDVEGASADTATPLHLESLPSPEELTASRQVQALVQEFVSTLDEGERILLNLRFVEGLSQRDTAERLSLGRQRLRGRETKLRRKLIRFLHDRGASELMPTGGMMWIAFAGQLPSLLDAALRALTPRQESLA